MVPATIVPASAPIAAAIPHDAARTRPVFTPTKRADSALLATARIASPNRVLLKSANSAPVTASPTKRMPID